MGLPNDVYPPEIAVLEWYEDRPSPGRVAVYPPGREGVSARVFVLLHCTLAETTKLWCGLGSQSVYLGIKPQDCRIGDDEQAEDTG